MALTPQWLDQLRSRVTLSAVIGRTTRLTKAGREFRACCPFHEEKTPSFYVNDAKGFYHCFGCGAHGDAIRWLTDQRGMPFMDAVKELAAEAGMDVPAPDPHAAKAAEKRASLHDVTTAAQAWFVAMLGGTQGTGARAYLERRGFSPATVREFGFGYAPEDRQALKRALGQFEEAMLVEAGMRIEVEEKEPYDRFRDRLMLPIHDMRGRVIAFGGRVLDPEGKPKYLNSPDTPLFDKGRTLYNLHRAAPASRQSGRMIVVEGYMDAIAMADAGIREVVAPLGTALTETQIEMLWRHVETPVLCFDGDAAGQRAAMRAVERALPLLKPGHSLAIVRMPAGQDPDDLIKAKGVAALEALLAEPRSILETLWTVERDVAPLVTPEDKAGLKDRLMRHVETIQHPEIRALYKRELSERFSDFAYPPRPQRPWTPRGEFRKGPFKAQAPILSPEAAEVLRRAISGGSRDGLLGAVLAGVARFPDQIVRHEEALALLARNDANVAPAIDLLLETAERVDLSGGSPISLAQGLPAPSDTARFAFLHVGTDPDDAREELAEAVSLLVERPALESALAEATARFAGDPEGSIAEQARLRDRLLALNERLKRFGRKKAAGDTQKE